MKSYVLIKVLLLAASIAFTEAADTNGGDGLTNDADILNYALTLEHLESAFYEQGLKKYDQSAFLKGGFSSTTRQSVQKLANDEASHVSFLTSALQAAGATPVQACNYTFPGQNVVDFMALSQILEGVGVSAYLGAAASIKNANYLTAAGSILTVEARHNAYVRFVNGESPFPTSMDTPVDPRSIYSMAKQFFVSCPNGSAPGFQAFPDLNITGKAVPGGNLTLASLNMTSATYCGFLSGLNSTFSQFANGTCQIPTDGKAAAGQVFVFLTNAQNVTDATVVAGPSIIEFDVPGFAQPFGGVNQTWGTSMPPMARNKATSGASKLFEISNVMKSLLIIGGGFVYSFI